jgi:hypothetical protein
VATPFNPGSPLPGPGSYVLPSAVPTTYWAYIVCFEHKKLFGNYDAFYAELLASASWWRYLNNTWIVIRTDALVTFADKLRAHLSANDRLLVMPAKGPADGLLPNEAWQWITANLPREW